MTGNLPRNASPRNGGDSAAFLQEMLKWNMAPLYDEQPRHVGHLTGLRWFDLQNNGNISDAGVAHLHRFDGPAALWCSLDKDIGRHAGRAGYSSETRLCRYPALWDIRGRH